MTILAEILDRVKNSDREQFRVNIEAKEVESKKFINSQGFDTLQDVLDRKLAAEQMTFQIDEASPLSGPAVAPVTGTPGPPPDSGSEIYKKFLDQLK